MFIGQCYNNSSNIDGFGECLKKKMDGLDKIKTEFSFRVQYFAIVGG
jgi:hypothetical protein